MFRVGHGGIWAAVLFASALCANAQSQTPSVDSGFGLGLNSTLTYWRGPHQTSGLQSFTPLDLWASSTALGGAKFDVAVKSAYVHSQSRMSDQSGSVSTITDTVGHVQLAFDKWAGIQPFIGVNVNAPTGKATLFGAQKLAIMDRDLVPQTRFGEGWNINPTVGATIPLGANVVASVGSGYNNRGSYVPDGDLAFRYTPGNQFIATVGMQYLSQAWLFSLNGVFTREGTSQLDGIDYFKPGDSYTVSAQAAYMWNDRHTTSVSGQFNHTQKNVSTNLLMGTFSADDRNTNSDVYVAGLAHHYALTDRWKLFGQFTFLRRNANLYEEMSDFYVSAKTKATIEAGVSLEAGQNATASLSLGYLNVKQDATPYLEAQQYHGVTGRASAYFRF